MHLTRQELSRQIPMPRKGTKYLARAASNVHSAVPVLIAVRDMLHLARTAKEVEKMIHNQLLSINGKIIHSPNAPIQLFHILKADKTYHLDLLPTGRFVLIESKSDSRLAKVTGKTILPGKKIQFHLHDGSNFISSDKINIGDSLLLDLNGKIKKHLPIEKSSKVLVFKGKFLGKRGVVSALKDLTAAIKFDKEDKTADISKSQFIVMN